MSARLAILAAALVLLGGMAFAPAAQAHLCYEGAACGPCTEGHHHHLNPDDHSPYCESDDPPTDPDPDPVPPPPPPCRITVKGMCVLKASAQTDGIFDLITGLP